MRKSRKNQKIVFMILIVAIISISIAFSALNATLKIDGTIFVKASYWNIKIENLQTAVLNGNAKESKAPTVESNTKIGVYTITIETPGDEVTYSFDVHNYGVIDSEIETLNIPQPTCKSLASDDQQKLADTETVCNGLLYTLKYEDGTEVKTKDELKAGQIKKIIFSIKYNGTTTPSDIVEISGLGIIIKYSQEVGENDVDLSTIKTFWLGDSIMGGVGNNGLAYPDYFNELTSSKYIKVSFGGSTLSDNTPYSEEFGHSKTFAGMIEKIVEEKNSIEADNSMRFEDVELVVLDGGGNDIIGYATETIPQELEKQIGTAEDTTSNTVLNDFRNIIASLKTLFPNAKILYIQTCAFDRIGLTNYATKIFVGDNTLEDINAAYSTNFTTMKEAKDVIATLSNMKLKIDTMVERANSLYTELPKVASSLGVEYLDLSSYIAAKLTTDTGDYVNPYLQNDYLHLTETAYRELTPHIISKVQFMIG